MPELHEWDRDQVASTPPGHIFYTQKIDDGPACLTLRRGGGSVCAYLSLPLGHPLVATEWEPQQCHGGMTYSAPTDWEPERWAWGWDYGHWGDELIFYPPQADAEFLKIRASVRKATAAIFLGLPIFERFGESERELWLAERAWMPLDVLADSQDAIGELRAALRAIEARRAMREAFRRGRRPSTWDQVQRLSFGVPKARRVPSQADVRRTREQNRHLLRSMARRTFRKPAKSR